MFRFVEMIASRDHVSAKIGLLWSLLFDLSGILLSHTVLSTIIKTLG